MIDCLWLMLLDLNPAVVSVMKSLSEIPNTEKEKTQQENNKGLLKLMPTPKLLHSLKSFACDHISCVRSDRIWVSYINEKGIHLVLTNTTGVLLHLVKDLRYYSILTSIGIHTINSNAELFYVDDKYNINKLSNDLKTTTTFIKRTNSTWRPQCVYWSPSTGDLLVGMYKYKSNSISCVVFKRI